MQFNEKKHKRIHINITSLIDVLFLLLIFFMISSTFLEQPGMKLDLPKSIQKNKVRMEGATLFITKDENIFLNDKPVSLSALKDSLTAIAPHIGDAGLLLKADEQVKYGLVIEVLDMIKSGKIEKLVVATEIKPEAQN